MNLSVESREISVQVNWVSKEEISDGCFFGFVSYHVTIKVKIS